MSCPRLLQWKSLRPVFACPARCPHALLSAQHSHPLTPLAHTALAVCHMLAVALPPAALTTTLSKPLLNPMCSFTNAACSARSSSKAWTSAVKAASSASSLPAPMLLRRCGLPRFGGSGGLPLL